MIAGRRPFEGKSQASLVGAILDDDPPSVAAVRPATPPLLAELVSRCLAKDREERWQSSRDLWRQLEAIAAHAAGGAATSSAGGETRTGTRRTIAILLAVAAVSGGMVAWALWPEPGPPALVSRLVVDLPERQTFTRTGRRILALSPDGSHLAYVANQEIYLRRLDDLTASPIRGTAATDPSEPAFSPDGRWIAFWSNGALWKVPVAGGAPARLAPAENPTGMSWQADRILVGQGASGIIDVPAAGGDPIRLITLDPARQELAQSPHRVAGGRAVLFTLRTGAQGWDDAEIVVQDLASGRRSVLVAGGTDARVSPGGHLIYAREGTLFAAAFDDASLRVSGTAKAVQPDVEAATGGFTGTAQFALSSSGTLAFVPGRSAPENRLVWLDRQGRTARPALPARRYKAGSAHMRISPDGTRAALTMLAAPGAGQANPGQDIWVWGLARDSLTRLTFTSSAASPVWTPDSRRICFNSASEVFCQAADGSGQPQPMFRVDRLLDLAQVSPDGRRILMEVGDADERSDIVMAPLQPGAQVQPVIATPASDESPSLSPDGRWLVYESNESGASQVYLRPFPEVSQGRWQLSTAGGVDPSWSRDGREVIFLEIATSGAAQPRAILSVSIPPGPPFVPAAPRLVVKYPANAARGFAEAADGRFLLSVPASSGDDEPAARPRIVVVQNWREELARLVPVR
jgi:Tol biopolymer transport system component